MSINKKDVAAILIFVALILAFVLLVNNITGKGNGRELEIVRDAVKNAALTCYAVEGMYPEDLKYLINNDKALEVNTAGLKYGLGYPHPQTKILKRYRELGGEMITIGSDGHRPEHICYGFGETREMLIDAGFKYQCVFKGRRPVMVEM